MFSRQQGGNFFTLSESFYEVLGLSHVATLLFQNLQTNRALNNKAPRRS